MNRRVSDVLWRGLTAEPPLWLQWLLWVPIYAGMLAVGIGFPIAATGRSWVTVAWIAGNACLIFIALWLRDLLLRQFPRGRLLLAQWSERDRTGAQPEWLPREHAPRERLQFPPSPGSCRVR